MGPMLVVSCLPCDLKVWSHGQFFSIPFFKGGDEGCLCLSLLVHFVKCYIAGGFIMHYFNQNIDPSVCTLQKLFFACLFFFCILVVSLGTH